MENDFFSIKFVIAGDSMFYMEEYENEFIYYTALPGIDVSNLSIKLNILEDLLIIKGYIEDKEKEIFKLVKDIDDVKQDNESIVSFIDKGTLIISILRN